MNGAALWASKLLEDKMDFRTSHSHPENDPLEQALGARSCTPKFGLVTEQNIRPPVP